MERDRPGIQVAIVTVHDYCQEQWNKRPESFLLLLFYYFFHQTIKEILQDRILQE